MNNFNLGFSTPVIYLDLLFIYYIIGIDDMQTTRLNDQKTYASQDFFPVLFSVI